MSLTRTFLQAAISLLLVTTAVSQEKGSILEQRDELNRIQKEVDRGKAALDSLKAEELSAQKRIADYDQKISSNKKVVSRLNRELSAIRERIGEADERLNASRNTLAAMQSRYLGNIHRFYLTSRTPLGVIPDSPNQELDLNREIVYLTALASFESGNVEAASAYLTESVEHLEDLTGESKKVTSLKKKRETAAALDKNRKERQEQKLQVLRRKKAEEADRILMLEQAAREMESIIARLEQERRRRERAEGSVSEDMAVFATLEGQLVPPCRGKIEVPFGTSVDQVTNLRSFSPGVTIRGKSGRNVVAVASGVVAYIGDLRGYGKFLILDHGEQYYSTFAGLGDVIVVQDQYVRAGDKLAVSASDGLVKYELRHGREPLDPVEWIRFDAF